MVGIVIRIVMIRRRTGGQLRGGRGGGERSGREFLGLLFEGALELFLDAGSGFLELAHGFTETARELRELLPAKQHQHDDEDEHHLAATEAFKESDYTQGKLHEKTLTRKNGKCNR